MSAPHPGVQLTFDLGPGPHARFESFEPGGNAAGVERLRAMAAGEPGHVHLQGGAGTGKSHLLRAACAAAQAAGHSAVYAPLGELAGRHPAALLDGLAERNLLCLDDIDAVAGEQAWGTALFNLWNAAEAAGGRCLAASRTTLYAFSSGLADLDSRLRAALSLRLAPLDDAGRAGALGRLAEQRGFQLAAPVVQYMMERLPRDMHSLAAAVALLDRRSLEQQRRITLPFARRCLEERGAGSG